jgi:hypothetical protein
VLTEFLISEGFTLFTACNDSQTVWHCGSSDTINQSLYCATFVDDVQHSTNDLAIYRTFCRRLEKKFDLESDDNIEVYLGNRITQDRTKGTVTMSQEHYLMACLESSVLHTAVALISLFLLDCPFKISRRFPFQLLKNFIVEWSAVSCILRRGVVWILHFLFLSCLDSSLILANFIWRQQNECSITSRKR